MNSVTRKASKKISILRLEYETYLGTKVCDRTWRRLKARLLISNENNLEEVAVVRGAALLRSFNATGKVNCLNAYQYGMIVDHFYPQGCNRIYGKDLAIAINTCFRNRKGNPPRRETLWKWGLRMADNYTLPQVKDFLRRAYLAGFVVGQVPQVKQIHLAA